MSKISEKLKEKRENLGIDIEEVSEDTRISEDILRTIETGEFYELPSYIHALNFIKQYSRYLGFDVDEIMTLFHEECQKSGFEKDKNNVEPMKPMLPPDKRKTEEEEEQEEASKEQAKKLKMPVVIAAVIVSILFIIFVISIIPSGKEDTKPEPVINKTEVKKQELVQPKKDMPFPLSKIVEGENVKKIVVTEEDIKPKTDEPQPEANAQDGNQAAGLNDKTVRLVFTDKCWVRLDFPSGKRREFIAEKNTTEDVELNNYFIMSVGNPFGIEVHHKSRIINNLGDDGLPNKNLKFQLSGSKLIYGPAN